MGKASSAKKVAKAARAGGRASGVRQRNLLFPGIIAGVVVLGTGLIVYARDDYQGESVNVAPAVGDHWHSAYGVYICDEFVDVAEQNQSPRGIHSHGDELIHIHPAGRAGSGDNAQMKVFLDDLSNLDADNDEITVGDETWKTGEDTCEVDGEEVEGEVVLAEWDDVALDTEPSLRTDIRNERFVQDGQGFVLAFVPEGETDDIPKPRSLDALTQVSGGAIQEPGFDPSTINPDDLPDGMTEEDFQELLEGAGTPAAGEGADPAAEGEGADAEGAEEQEPAGPEAPADDSEG
jgi:hypothetical protein